MAYDIFNYGANPNQSLQTQDDYQQTQFNSVGQTLGNNTLSNGAPVANDFSNDNRTPQDFKRQLREANLDTLPLQDTSNKYVFADGSTADKTPDSRTDGWRYATQAYANAYFSHMGDQTEAIAAGALSASQAYTDIKKRKEREDYLPTLEAKTNPDGTPKYNSLDLSTWLNDGNTTSLIKNAGSWTSDGNGFMHNTLTGAVYQIPDYNQTKPNELKYLQNPDGTYTAVNPITNQTIGSAGVANTPGTIGNGGDIGLDEDEANDTPSKVNGVYGTYDKKGNFKPLGVKEQEYWRNQANGSATAPDANQKLVTDDLNVVNSATPDQLDHITGNFIGRNTMARDVSSSLDPETRKIYMASERLSTQMGNAAIAAAKNAGASGINTEAEIKRFTQGVPQVDYTSQENYKASIERIQTYSNDFRDQLIRKNGGKTTGATSHISDDELLNKYLPKKGG